MKEKEKAVITDGEPNIENLCRDELRILCTTVLKAILEKITKNEKGN